MIHTFNMLSVMNLAIKQIGLPCIYAELNENLDFDTKIGHLKIIMDDLNREYAQYSNDILKILTSGGLISVPSIEIGLKLVTILNQSDALNCAVDVCLYDSNGNEVDHSLQ